MAIHSIFCSSHMLKQYNNLLRRLLPTLILVVCWMYGTTLIKGYSLKFIMHWVPLNAELWLLNDGFLLYTIQSFSVNTTELKWFNVFSSHIPSWFVICIRQGAIVWKFTFAYLVSLPANLYNFWIFRLSRVWNDLSFS